MKAPLTLATGVLLSALASAANDPNDPNEGALDLGQTSQPEAAGQGMPSSPLLSSLTTLYADSDKEVTWGGRLMEDMGFFSKDDAYPATTEDGFELRRARFFAKIKLYGTVEAKAQYDFAGQDADFKDVYMKFPTPFGKIQVGHFKQPFSMEEQTSSRYITFMERPSPVEAFAPSRDNGIGTSGTIDENTHWAVGFFKRSNDAAKGTGDGDYITTARLTHYWGEDAHVLHVGTAVSSWSGQDVRFKSRPEAHLVSNILDTSSMPSDSTLLVNFESAWVNGPFSAQAEYLSASINNFGGTGSPDVTIDGWYAQMSYFITGENRQYESSGHFGRIHPNQNYDGTTFTSGAWEVAARVSSTDFDEVSGGTLTNLTAGVNWYLDPNSRLTLNFVNSNIDNGGLGLNEDMNALMMRFEVDW